MDSPDVIYVGRRWCYCQGADRGDGLVIEDREPGSAGIDRFPDTAVHVAEVELVGPAGHAARGVTAAAAERAQHAPVEADVLGARGEGFGAGEKRRQDGRMLREPERRERDAGLGDSDEEVAARGGGHYGVTLPK